MSTLIEKLEAKLREFEADYVEMTAPSSKANVAGNMNGLRTALNITKQHSDWISINERLPSVNLKVLAFHERKNKVFIATYDRDLEMWLEGGLPYSSNFLYWITHWQPLPQPPIEVKP